MGFDIGRTVGGYEFLDVLGTSKTGVAYKVRNVIAQRLETLRILSLNAQDDQERVERFLREIKVHARLVHPNIVCFYNAMEIEGQLVMTTELVEGTSLAQRLEHGPIPCVLAIDYMGQVLSALTYAHAHGIVHRDLTPANMIVTEEGKVMLTGFGLAKAATDPHLTQAGTVMGAVKYISPEQVKGVSTLDPRADIYSLGAVLYEVVTGKVPFDAKSQFDVMLAHVNTSPKPPSSIKPDVFPVLEQIILTALAKDPAQRFQTADEFRVALESAKHNAKQSVEQAAVKPLPKAKPEADSRESLKREPQRQGLPPLPAPGQNDAAKEIPVPVTKNSTETPSIARTVSLESLTKKPSSAWGWPELILAGILTFIISTVTFLALLTMSGARSIFAITH